MILFLSGCALVLTLLGAFVVTMNYVCVIKDHQNRRRAIKEHVSTVPLVSQMFLFAADLSLWIFLFSVIRLWWRR